MGDLDDLKRRMLVGNMMRDAWEANPPDPAEWVRALEGCAELYRLAAQHLAADPPRYLEAVKAIGPAVETGAEVRGQALIAYAMSGQAADDFMANVHRSLEEQDGDAHG